MGPSSSPGSPIREERRRRALRLRLLRGRPHDVANGQPAADGGDCRDPRIKPAIYPKVDDEATILVETPKAQGMYPGVVELAIWRKDDVYGATGYAIATGGDSLRVRLPKEAERSETPEPRTPEERDELAYFPAMVRGWTTPSGLSSLDNNVMVTRDSRRGARVRGHGRGSPAGAADPWRP